MKTTRKKAAPEIYVLSEDFVDESVEFPGESAVVVGAVVELDGYATAVGVDVGTACKSRSNPEHSLNLDIATVPIMSGQLEPCGSLQ